MIAPSRSSIPVSRPSFTSREESAVIDVLRSGWVTQGPRVAEFEERFAEYVGAEDAVAVSSCTTALHLALVAAGIGPGDEVLCPSLSFIATANAIVHAGATPVFVDIHQTTYNMDPNRIAEAITPRTKAILAVHQIGLPAALDEIGEVALRYRIPVIEDAACAIGAEYKGRRIGCPHTLMACFSFHPRKILTTGEGGMITTRDAQISARLRRLRQHAMTLSDMARHSSRKVATESYNEIGFNYRMTDLQAAIGLVQLERLDQMIARRRQLASRYSSRLSSLDWLELPTEVAGTSQHNYQSYMVRLNERSYVNRDELMQRMLDHGVSLRRGVMAIHRELPYRSDHWDRHLPITDAVSRNTVMLPLFHDITEEDQDYVIERLKGVAG